MQSINHARQSLALAALATLSLVLARPAGASTNLVTNGNFGTGDYSGWTLGGDSSGDYIFGPDSVHTYAAALTTNAADTGTLSQYIATVVGQDYTVSYDLAGDGATPNSFTAAFGGKTLDSEANIPDDLGATQTFDGPPESHSFVASAPSSNLVFTYSDAPGYLYLGNVSVTANSPVSAVPEPSSFSLLGLGLLPLGMIAKKRHSLRA